LVAGLDFLPENERALVEAAVKFPELTIRDVMTPRSKISFIKDSASLGPKVIDELYATQQKIFPVAHGDLEHTLGVILLEEIAEIAKGDQSLKDAARERPMTLPQDQSILETLELMLKQGLKLVYASDGSGKIVGMLEFERVMELLLGQEIE
jgi:CBS domain containing-hemolysin-like protein